MIAESLSHILPLKFFLVGSVRVGCKTCEETGTFVFCEPAGFVRPGGYDPVANDGYDYSEEAFNNEYPLLIIWMLVWCE